MIHIYMNPYGDTVVQWSVLSLSVQEDSGFKPTQGVPHSSLQVTQVWLQLPCDQVL